ncbi:four-carbon acid sugar kinase family protein [uncultured Roseobacter sp.]|uniref:four-carbon acid sugar kinase family protein n=1 Tax=uncultured Roseobacter sp. TaxID=114847 RepID=UPI00263700EF|nr:four-carbon acid sugar kinase family protein [uncultured Roseobacter sp.]
MTRALPSGLLVAWYGDDYTGAAAVMEVLTFSGLPSVLFLDIPTPEQMAQFSGYRGIGIAGSARSRAPTWMHQHLPPVFDFLAALEAPVTHYKVCSTFDSSPTIGSIGRATDIALCHVPAAWAALLVAAPAIGRYQAFGTLFATAGNTVHRLDRHPVMSQHPVTPMEEADVTRHIAQQTDLGIGLVPLSALQSDDTAAAALEREREKGARLIALDTVDPSTLSQAGRLIWEHGGTPTLAIGSQGVEYALVRHWQDTGLVAADPPEPRVGPVGQMAVVAGSASATTDAQIDWAEANGFSGHRIDPAMALETGDALQNWIASQVDAALKAGPSPIVYSARGPDDPGIAAFRNTAATAGLAMDEANARLGAALGGILSGLIEHGGHRRAAIAGGDTSSHAVNSLGVHALTAIAATVPGAALCQGHRDDNAPLEIALKGGQMGTPDFFGRIRAGGGQA